MRHGFLGYTLWTACAFIQFPTESFANKFDVVRVPFETAEITDTKKVSVIFGDRIYKIPSNYVTGVRQPEYPGAYAQFGLIFLLPNLTPRTQDNRTEFDVPSGGDAIRVNVEYGVHYDPEEVVINRMIGLEKMSKDSYAVTNSGFKLYKFGSNGISPELYVKAIGGDVKFHFICNTIERVPYPSCTVFSNIDENLHIQYYFPRKYIDTAYEEYIKIINLVNSFAEN